MKAKNKLSRNMTIPEFDNGYWYADELKIFGETLGIPGAKKLRKDELEKAIKTFISTGKIKGTTRQLTKVGPKDLDGGLTLNLQIQNYVGNKETKDFIKREAEKISPGIKKRSGAGYRLNRWRDEQLSEGNPITYGDLVAEYVRINSNDEPFAKIPHGRYINFLSEYMAAEKHATKDKALKAWETLKKLDISKDYKSWSKYRKKGL